ncbi:MAG TPA: bifunctional diguanylate cyclase/phosphodiesterase [Steroidobacteraceae bacterium]|nr:bifunctional diguanylate cyclase/phosphodiesterase [Steroidobacteraceae bacterium]
MIRGFNLKTLQRWPLVLDIKSNTVETHAADASFDPYGRLLRMLMPSLRGVVIHDGYSNLVWASDEWDLSDEPQLINDAIANALSDSSEFPGIARTIDADRVVYSFAVRGEHIELLGIVSLVVRLSGVQIEPRPLQTVRQLVQPALECLRRELSLRAKLGSSERDLNVKERDLELMMEITSNQAAASDADEFSQILKTGLDRMGCALAALWVPDKNISVSMTRSGAPMAPEALQRAQHHLTAWMQMQQRTIVINHISKVATDVAAPYKILACPIRHHSERVMGVLALFNPPSAQDFDLQQTRVAEMLAKRSTNIIQAQYDTSTGLMTRQAFERQAGGVLAAAPAGSHIILYLDIDRLHVINETFGMHVGDDVIVSVADRMAKTLPPGALSARISGDRLAALIPGSSMESAAQIAEQIRAAAEGIVPRAGQGAFEVSVCLGVAPIGRSDNPLAHALATAEIACKAAKDRGRNRVEMFQDSDQSIIRRHTDILVIGKLREALDSDGFRLDAQPILPLRGNYGRPRFELLIRMLGERGEIIPPGKFLSSAERYQLMPTIDRWVVRKACELLGAHSASVGEEFARFAINLSGQSLQDESFLGFVVEQLKSSGLPAGVLCFELTETATIGNLEKAQLFMRTLQELGCQFALDDFGTGVSSLAYLKDLSVNYIKIDGSFVRDAVSNARSESMIKAIAQLAKVMCMETIAEYVETDVLRVRMADLGVDYGQGFAMGKAQRLEDLLQELAIYEATVSNWGDPESPAERVTSEH